MSKDIKTSKGLVFGNDCKQRLNVLTNSSGENGKPLKIMLKGIKTFKGVPEENGKRIRENKINSPSLLVGSSANKTPSAGFDKGNKESSITKSSVPLKEDAALDLELISRKSISVNPPYLRMPTDATKRRNGSWGIKCQGFRTGFLNGSREEQALLNDQT